MKKLILIAMIFLLLPTLCAASFVVSAVPIKDSIFANESAKYQITIENKQLIDDSIRIMSDILGEWFVDYEPKDGSIPALGKKDFNVTLTPVQVRPGAQRVNFFLRSNNDPSYNLKVGVIVSVKSQEGYIGTYMPGLIPSLDIPQQIDPRKDLVINVYIRNGNWLELPNVEYFLTGNLVNVESNISLNPLETKVETITVKLDPYTPAGEKYVNLVVKTEGITFGPLQRTVNVISYSNPVVTEKTTGRFLSRTKSINIKNEGNTNHVGAYALPMSFFGSIFSSTSPKASVQRVDGTRSVVWEVNLAPGEEIILESTFSFLVPVLIVLIILISYGLYYLLRSPIILKKTASIIEKGEEGGISEIKILVTLKNRTKHGFVNINIMDKLPNIVEVIQDSYLGTVRPNKILYNDKKGTLIKWKLESMDGFEERVLTYKIKSKLTILGSVTLKPAVANFTSEEQKVSSIKSNTVVLRSQ